MSRHPERLLRWYPPAWRARYGEELAALVEDAYGGRRLPLRQRLSLAGHGLKERARASGLVDAGDPGQRARSGALVVLCAWSLFVIAGGGFAKYVEHWDAVTPGPDRWLPGAAYDVVVAAAVAGAALIACGALLALGAFVGFLRAGRWREIRPFVVTALALTALTVSLTVVGVLWAHGQSATGRNTTSVVGTGLGGVWGLGLVGTLAAWCAAAVATVRRLELSPRVLRVEGGLAVALVGAMAAVTAGVVTWWAAVAVDAPGFLSQGPLGDVGPGVAPPLVVAGLLMVAGLVIAATGAWRVVRALAALPA